MPSVRVVIVSAVLCLSCGASDEDETTRLQQFLSGELELAPGEAAELNLAFARSAVRGGAYAEHAELAEGPEFWSPVVRWDGTRWLPADVSPSLIKVKVGNEERMLDDNDKDGTWQAVFDYLLPGLYPVTLGAPEGLKLETSPALPIEIEVEAGKDINKEITIKSVSTVVP